MKKLFFSGILALLALPALSQVPTLSDMQLPNAPGFVLTDKAPTAIDKPVDPKTFAVSLYNLTQGGAIECTPFWFFQHKNYTLKTHVEKKAPLLPTLNLSVASVKIDSNTNLSIGIRTQLVRIYDKATKNKLYQLSEDAAMLMADFDTDPNVLVKVKQIVKDMNELKAKVPFCIEFAGAVLGNYDKNTLSNSSISKWGVWLNTRISPPKWGFDMTVLARYIYTPQYQLIPDASYFDYGIACSYQKNRIDGALEYVNRMDFTQDKVFDRVSFAVNYKVNDEITIVSSLGKNFNTVNNIFSVWGIKFGTSSMKAL